jgi:2-iminobutanoate/2-iminopropanoate deaminase
MNPRIIHTKKVAPGRARISQAVEFAGIVYVSGIVARDPATGKTVTGGIAAQTKQVLTSIKDILEEAGTTVDRVIKTEVFLQDMDQFGAFNKVWENFFPVNPPARICIQAGKLGPGFEVEITAIAAMPSSRA